MRLFEAIIEANHRACNGDQNAAIHTAPFVNSLPVVALTCIDPRLNSFFPNVLGVPEDKFIWLRNAGNMLTSTLSSTIRSLSLACAVEGGREIAVIGHTDCNICKTPIAKLIDRFNAIGIQRDHLPPNLTEFFGTFASEQQNVIRAVDLIRSSPIISSEIPIHGLMVDTQTGRLNWIINGYEALEKTMVKPPVGIKLSPIGGATDDMENLTPFHIGELKFPASKIGEGVATTQNAPLPPTTPPQQPPSSPAPAPTSAVPPVLKPYIQKDSKIWRW